MKRKREKVMTSVLTAGALPSQRSCWLLAASILLLGGCTLFASEPNIMLSAQEEVPAVSSMGFGMGRITVSKDRSVSGRIKVSNVQANAAHIHVGGVGKIGPPIVNLNRISDAVWAVPMGTVFSEGQYASYLAGELYINVHSEKYKGGEIRGQLQPQTSRR
jgi:hypothetical protein